MVSVAQERADAAVAAGAKYLDKKLPMWEYQIDLKRLDLGDGCHCVLGQLATDIIPRKRWVAHMLEIGSKMLPAYHSATKHLNLSMRDCQKYGFTYGEGGGDSFPALTRAWKRLIKQRLEG